MNIDIQTLAEDMYNLVAETHGVERYKPQDVFRAMTKKHKDKGVNKKDCKAALKSLIEEEKLVYNYLNGSCTSLVELPDSGGEK